MGSKSKSVVVIGDGWAALGAVGFLVLSGKSVKWVAGTGARGLAALPSLETYGELKGAAAWKALCDRLEVSCGEPMSGSFLREFKNKSFREPVWMKQSELEARIQSREENLWSVERLLAPLEEVRFSRTLNEMDAGVREILQGERFRNVKRIDGVPVTGLKVEGGEVVAVILGSGEEIACEHVIYADRWSELAQIQGIPKPIPFTRKREPVSVLQATFTHEKPVAQMLEGFFAPLHREAGEQEERHLWGHFSSDGRKSYWTLCLGSEESEDNHTISKKLRRLKNALDKMFVGTGWLPEGTTEFMANVAHEQVRFEESFFFSGGEVVTEPATLSALKGISFLTDGYGPSSALHQVAVELGLMNDLRGAELGSQGPDSETKDLDGATAAGA